MFYFLFTLCQLCSLRKVGRWSIERFFEMKIAFDQLMKRHKVQITLQWIPRHKGIKGNEEANSNKLAKQGASQPHPKAPLTYMMVKADLKKWMKGWSRISTGRAIYEYMNAPRTKNPINALKRKK